MGLKAEQQAPVRRSGTAKNLAVLSVARGETRKERCPLWVVVLDPLAELLVGQGEPVRWAL